MDVISLAPWELIAEFNNLDEVLNIRLSSRTLAECVSRLSPFVCASFLKSRLVATNVVLVNNQTWKKPCEDFVSYLTSRSGQDPFDVLIFTLRTLHFLPMEVAVAFSGKFGRHSIPLEMDEGTNTLRAMTYPLCQKSKCSSCRFRIPHDKQGKDAVYDFISIRHAKQNLDLIRFYPKCIPNLPANLHCPFCRYSGERTLVLSMISYKSSGLDYWSLTFTPYNEVDYSEAEGNDESDDDEHSIPPTLKRSRSDSLTKESFAYPNTHHDCAIPHFDEYIPADQNNTKYAISIHCTECENFGVVAPATPCLDRAFACHHVASPIEFAGQKSTIGRILVRNKCAKCNRATLCRSCCLRQRHKPYACDLNQESVTRKFWCEFCNPTADDGIYCPSCAYLATVCHHI
jgi:hypothetical protein